MAGKNHRLAFSKTRLEQLPLPASGRIYWYDENTPGLCLSVTAGGSRVFYLYRKIRGRPVRYKIGAFPEWSVRAAREQADKLKGRIAQGEDPQADRVQARGEATWGDLFAYWLDYARRHKKTAAEDQRLYNKFLEPLAGRQLSTISRRDVELLHAKVGERSGPYQANRVLEIIRAAFAKADRIGWRGDNSAAGVPKFPERSRDRHVEAHELRPLFEALTAEPPLTRDFFTLALLTGARRSNLQGMEWADINLDAGIWRIPHSKSGQAVLVPLIPLAVEILRNRREAAGDSPWVFATHSKVGHLVEPKTAWKRVCERAGLADLRVHDLRRTLGSWQAALGSSLPIIGKSLGHRDGSPATAVYARLTLVLRQSSIDG